MNIQTTKTAIWINFDGYAVSIWNDGEVIVDRPKKKSRSSSVYLNDEQLGHLVGLLAA